MTSADQEQNYLTNSEIEAALRALGNAEILKLIKAASCLADAAWQTGDDLFQEAAGAGLRPAIGFIGRRSRTARSERGYSGVAFN